MPSYEVYPISVSGTVIDSKTFVSLAAAVASIGATDTVLSITRAETVNANLTIPANITLRLAGLGAINPILGATVTIQSPTILAGDEQIFGGAGNINFANGTVVRSSWFSSCLVALQQTQGDEVRLEVIGLNVIGTSVAVGNYVTLGFESYGARLSVGAGVVLSNIGKIIAPRDVIFTGAGDYDFVEGTELSSAWFVDLETAWAYIDDDNVNLTLRIDRTEPVTNDVTLDRYIHLRFTPGNTVAPTAGRTLTLYSPEHVLANPRQQVKSGDGALAFTVPGVVYPGWLGILGDGTDESALLLELILMAGNYGTIHFMQPPVAYGTGAPLAQMTGQKWIGEGSFISTIIRKLFDGVLVSMIESGELRDLKFDCNGATYTGMGILVFDGYSQIIDRCYVLNSEGIGICFNVNAGGGAVVSRTEVVTTSPDTVAAISSVGLFEATANPRFFDNLWLSGGHIDFSGMNGTFLSNSYLRRFITSDDTNQLQVVNCRLAALGGTIVLYGHNNSMSNCAVAGVLDIGNSAQGWKLTNIAGITDITETGPTNYNSFEKQAKQYTPTWDQSAGVQPAIGNGTLDAWYVRNGYLCTVQIRLTGGTTTIWGNGATYWRFSIPYPGHASLNQSIPYTARGVDATGPTDYQGHVEVPGTFSWCYISINGMTFRSDGPFTWANGDTLDIFFTYMTQ